MKTIHTYITEKLKIRKTNNTPVFYITDADSLEKYVNEHFNKDTKHLDLRNISFERCEDINKQRYENRLAQQQQHIQDKVDQLMNERKNK
jgi:hypothetical protein